MVMASEPGGTGPPTHSQWSPCRSKPTSVQAGGQRPAIRRGAGVVRPQQFEEVHELLPRRVVLFDPFEQGVEARSDLAVRRGLGLGRTDPGDGGDPAGLVRLGDAGQQGQGLLAVAPGGQEFGQAQDRRFVRGVQLQGDAERVLVALGRQEVGVALRRRDPFDELPDPGFGDGPDERVDDLAVLDGVDGRNGLHLEGGRDPPAVVDVHLHELDLALGLADDFF